MTEERLQKILARADIGSRRACEQIIGQGRVTVNGKVATIGDKADPQRDTIAVDGQVIKLSDFEKRYIVFHKPAHVLSTNRAPEDDTRATIRDLIPVEGHWFTIGRLDASSEGLLVLTNDGELTHKLSHPSFEHTKTYKVTVSGHPNDETLEKWERGLWLDDSRTAPCFIKVLEHNQNTTVLRIVMIEGRKRQIRRIAAMLGHPVKRLVRTHIGQLGLGTLKKGAWYELQEEEVDAMKLPAEEVVYIRRKGRKARPPRKPVTSDSARARPSSRRPNSARKSPISRKPSNNPRSSRKDH